MADNRRRLVVYPENWVTCQRSYITKRVSFVSTTYEIVRTRFFFFIRFVAFKWSIHLVNVVGRVRVV